MRNIEIKVRVPDLELVRHDLIALGAVFRWSGVQTDTYFRVRQGRLKLREIPDCEPATLIAYARPDEISSRISQYQLLPISEPATMKQMLGDTLGVLANVRKTRELYIYGETRIHLDQVDGLGTFVELETVLGEQTMEIARQEHQLVSTKLRLQEHESIALSYSDLIIRGQTGR